jgi:predicted RNA binding protein YcfA (HicA-like mRNA interferase family)
MKVKEMIRLIENDSWPQVRQKGSHHQFNHPIKKERL